MSEEDVAKDFQYGSGDAMIVSIIVLYTSALS